MIDIEGLIKDMTVVQKQLYERMVHELVKNAPQTYYMNPYELAEEYGFDASDWEKLITHDTVDTYIRNRIVQMTEFDARKALYRLANDPSLSSQDVSALKELLLKSKLFESQQSNHEIFLTHIPMEVEEVVSNSEIT